MSLQEVREESKKDHPLQKQIKALTGSNNQPRSDELKKYENIKDEITCNDGVVLRNNKIMLLGSLQKRAIDLAHRSGDR